MRQAQRTGRGMVWGAVLAAGGAATLAAGAAHAQLSPNKGPIDISADSVNVRDPEHVVIYKGRVEALQDQDRLRSDLLNIYYKPTGQSPGAPKSAPASASAPAPGADFGAIDHLEAIGNVYLVRPAEVAKGDKAVYTADNQTIVITGDVVLTRGEDVARGSRLVIDIASGNSTLEGGGGASPSGRPRTVVYPKQTPKQAPQQTPQQTPQGTSR